MYIITAAALLLVCLLVAKPVHGELLTTDELLVRGWQLEQQGDLKGAEQTYFKRIQETPTSPDAWHFLGALALKMGQINEAVRHMEHSISLPAPKPEMFCNLGEAYRRAGRIESAIQVLQRGLQLTESCSYNLAVTLVDSGQLDQALVLYNRSLAHDPTLSEAAKNMSILLAKRRKFQEALEVLEKGIGATNGAGRCSLILRKSIVLQQMDQLREAQRYYEASLECLTDPAEVGLALTNVGTLYGSLGNHTRALEYLNRSFEHVPPSCSILNNIGNNYVLLGQMQIAALILRDTIDQFPTCWEAFINLGAIHYLRGDHEGARANYLQAAAVHPEVRPVMEVRTALLSPTIMVLCHGPESCAKAHRSGPKAALRELEARFRSNSTWLIENPAQRVEWLPFFWVYQGENEYANQARLSATFRLVSPSYFEQATRIQPLVKDLAPIHTRPIRVGFISRYWHENHPHGQLLANVIRAASQRGVDSDSQGFLVTVFVLPNNKGGPSRQIQDACSSHCSIVQIEHGDEFDYHRVIQNASLDVLLYAETLSEPIGYFLAQTRLATVQAAFWGTPLTSGSPHMDYFISGDWLETPCSALGCCMGRDKLPHYTEQVVRLPRSGILYDPIHIPQSAMARVQERKCSDVVIWGVLQNIFKIHPAFDMTLSRVLELVPGSELMILQGSSQHQTEVLKQRLIKSLGSEKYERVRFVPKVATSDEYLNIMSQATVILHPFPFDGSKTSFDALVLGLPIVVLEGAFARGRMGAALYREIGYVDLITATADDYVHVAVQLGTDCGFRTRAARRIQTSMSKYFENNKDGAAAWLNWMTRVARSAELEKRFTKSQEKVDFEALIRRAIQDGLLDQALEYSTLRLQKESMSASALIDHGAVLMHLGRAEEALSFFRAALNLDPLHPMAHNNAGVVLRSLGDLGGAQVEFEQALALDSSSIDAVLNLGTVLSDRDLFDDAFSLYCRALGIEMLSIGDQVTILVIATFDIPVQVYPTIERMFGQHVKAGVENIKKYQLKELTNKAARLIPYRQVETWQLTLPLLPRSKFPSHLSESVELICQLYVASSQARNDEMLLALSRNLANPFVRQVHILVEDISELALLGIVANPKLVIRVTGKQLTFAMAIRYANQLPKSTICVFANADIELDRSVARLGELMRHKGDSGVVAALSRWERNGSEPVWQPRSDSQDTWAFRSPLDVTTGPVEFELGRERCDNRFAAVLEEQGVKVFNPALDVRTFHHHQSELRVPSWPVPGRGTFISPSLSVYLQD